MFPYVIEFIKRGLEKLRKFEACRPGLWLEHCFLFINYCTPNINLFGEKTITVSQEGSDLSRFLAN